MADDVHKITDFVTGVGSKALTLFELSKKLKGIQTESAKAFRAGDFKKAERGYTIITKEEPDYVLGHICLYFTLARLNKKADALDELNKAISLLEKKMMEKQSKKILMDYLRKQIEIITAGGQPQ